MKTISKVFLFAMLVFIQYGLLAQNNRQDVVYLKNGGVTRGTIIELIPEKQIKIETVDGNVFVYQMSEIEKYAKEPTFTSKHYRLFADRKMSVYFLNRLTRFIVIKKTVKTLFFPGIYPIFAINFILNQSL